MRIPFFLRGWLPAFLLLLSAGLVLAALSSWLPLGHLLGKGLRISTGPWGELEELDLRLEQPEEYVGFEKVNSDGPYWIFGPVTEPALRSQLGRIGLSEVSVDRLLARRIPGTGNIVVIRPDREFVLGLRPEIRSELYRLLAGNASNRFQTSPYVIPDGNVAKVFEGHPLVNRGMRRMVKSLLYDRNGFTYFSDPETVLMDVTDSETRLDFLKALTGQNTVLLRLHIRPEMDIDKPLNYWGLAAPWVLVKDLRPLFESLKRLPQGGAVSLLYLLPPMARYHLLTSSIPPSPGSSSPLPDCHWSALNFFALNPDPKMADNAFASDYIARNFYEIARPSLEGDLVLLVDSNNRVLHSSVYLADGIVFTKNGINFAQPWVSMRIRDMVANFSALEPVRVACFRRRDM